LFERGSILQEGAAKKILCFGFGFRNIRSRQLDVGNGRCAIVIHASLGNAPFDAATAHSAKNTARLDHVLARRALQARAAVARSPLHFAAFKSDAAHPTELVLRTVVRSAEGTKHMLQVSGQKTVRPADSSPRFG